VAKLWKFVSRFRIRDDIVSIEGHIHILCISGDGLIAYYSLNFSTADYSPKQYRLLNL